MYPLGVSEVSFDDDARSLARYCVIDEDAPDQNSVADEPAPSNLRNRLRLLPDGEVPEGWMTLACAVMTERPQRPLGGAR